MALAIGLLAQYDRRLRAAHLWQVVRVQEAHRTAGRVWSMHETNSGRSEDICHLYLPLTMRGYPIHHSIMEHHTRVQEVDKCPSFRK
eukprot:scaffold80353_cov33-Tisochrysis_lutea.AAC.4